MNTLLRGGLSAAILAAIVIIGAMGIQQYDPAAAIKVVTIPAGSFSPTSHLVEFHNDCANLYIIKENGESYIRAPLILPNNTLIQKVVLICKDSDPTYDITVWVHHVSNDFSESTTFGYVKSSGAATDWRQFTATFSGATINNVDNVYFLNCRLPQSPDQKLCLSNVKVYYKGKW